MRSRWSARSASKMEMAGPETVSQPCTGAGDTASRRAVAMSSTFIASILSGAVVGSLPIGRSPELRQEGLPRWRCGYGEEGPDLPVSLHSHGANPAVLRPAFVTLDVQEEVRRLAQRYYEILKKNRLPFGQLFRVEPEKGDIPPPFNLTSALYHVSGATSFTFECPHGLSGDYCQVNLEQILDVQLFLYEAMMEFALDEK